MQPYPVLLPDLNRMNSVGRGLFQLMLAALTLHSKRTRTGERSEPM